MSFKAFMIFNISLKNGLQGVRIKHKLQQGQLNIKSKVSRHRFHLKRAAFYKMAAAFVLLGSFNCGLHRLFGMQILACML